MCTCFKEANSARSLQSEHDTTSMKRWCKTRLPELYRVVSKKEEKKITRKHATWKRTSTEELSHLPKWGLIAGRLSPALSACHHLPESLLRYVMPSVYIYVISQDAGHVCVLCLLSKWFPQAGPISGKLQLLYCRNHLNSCVLAHCLWQCVKVSWSIQHNMATTRCSAPATSGLILCAFILKDVEGGTKCQYKGSRSDCG